MKKTILVTGGAGFIGSNFVLYLLKKYTDCRIICLDKLTYAGNLRSLAPALSDARLRIVQADICDRDTVSQLFEEEHPAFVVHFAAETHVDRALACADDFARTNISGTLALLEVCCAFGVERFHQVSTDEVYGDLPLDRTDLAFTEDSSLHPNNPYSCSKAAADLFVLACMRTHGLPVSISRCSNNYGPCQFPEKLIPLTLVNALHGRPIPVYGDGLHVRDWLFVTDHCRAIDLILRCGKSGEIYNVGARNEMCNIELVRAICRELGKPESQIEFVTDRKGHDRRYALDAAKLCALGWTPKTDMREGLKKTVRWYLSNQAWLESILSGEYRHDNDEILRSHAAK